MGGATNVGGMWPEQASAELFAKDAGRPTPLASGVAFIPSHVIPAPEGYPDTGTHDTSLAPPALFKIRVVVAGQLRMHQLPWRRGKSIKQYLRDVGLVSARMRLALNIDGRKRVTMAYVPRNGESLNMVPSQRPLLQLRDA